MNDPVVEVMLVEGRWTVRFGAATVAALDDQPAAVACAQAFADRQGTGETTLRVLVHFPPGWRSSGSGT